MIEKKQGWSQSGKLTTNSQSRTVTCQGDFQPFADYFTVQFSVSQVPAGKAQRTEAIVMFTVEGNVVQRRVTVGNGVSVSGPGQAIRVIAKDATQNDAPSFDYNVAIQIAPGTRPAIERPPVLYENVYDVAPAGGTVDVVVPQDAGVISVNMAVIMHFGPAILPPPANVAVQVRDAANNIIEQFYYSGSAADFVTLPGDAANLLIVNLDPANTANVTVQWGIDG